MQKFKLKIRFNKKIFFKVANVFSYIFYGLVFIFALTLVFSKYSIAGVKLFSVHSGSMEPSIKVGSLVFVKFQEEYQKGDIITFYNSALKKETTTHRISDIKQFGFQTKGDANDAPDSDLVPKEMVIGKAQFSIPYLGYFVSFTHTLPGLIFLIIVPATIIVYEEILKIKKEIYLWRKKKYSN